MKDLKQYLLSSKKNETSLYPSSTSLDDSLHEEKSEELVKVNVKRKRKGEHSKIKSVSTCNFILEKEKKNVDGKRKGKKRKKENDKLVVTSKTFPKGNSTCYETRLSRQSSEEACNFFVESELQEVSSKENELLSNSSFKYLKSSEVSHSLEESTLYQAIKKEIFSKTNNVFSQSESTLVKESDEFLNTDKSNEVLGTKENCDFNIMISDNKSIESPECYPLTAPKNKILNYFSKIDKLPNFSEHKILTVTAIVHSPAESRPSLPIRKLRMNKKKKEEREDPDIIISEGSVSEPIISPKLELTASNRRPWKMRVKLSPSKEVENQKVEDDCEAVQIENEEQSPQIKTAKLKNDGTLASYFFIKGDTPKTLSDSLTNEQKAAKQKFLKSGVPENMKKIIKNVISEQKGSPAPFPKQNHILQKDSMSLLWNLPLLAIKLKKIRRKHKISEITWTTLLENMPTRNYNESFSVVSNIKRAVKDLKKKNKDLPFKLWCKEMQEMKVKNEFEIWSEKYHPNNIEHFIHNQHNIQKLKKWLEIYQTRIKLEKDESSGDEFINSNDEDHNILNVALLIGPNGIGKTSAVYAVAKELGYQVLESNAGSNRSGKKILHEFSEATQSHKVDSKSTPFGKVKKKKKDKTSSKKTLILIEDADIAFQEHDEGFISAITLLANSSKRPLVLIANDESCKHLYKLKPYFQLCLNFSQPQLNKLEPWLRTLGVTEGILLDNLTSSNLISCSNGDVRKCLLQMQFFTSSTHSFSFSNIFCKDWVMKSLWKNFGNAHLDKQEENEYVRSFLKSITTLEILSQKLFQKASANFSCMPYWFRELKDGISLEESMFSVDYLSLTIFDEILFRSQHIYEIKTPIHLDKTIICSDLNNLVEDGITKSALLSRRNIAMDYLPTIRSITRSESNRLSSHTKRNNRFLNYLQTVGIFVDENLIQNLISVFSYR